MKMSTGGWGETADGRTVTMEKKTSVPAERKSLEKGGNKQPGV